MSNSKEAIKEVVKAGLTYKLRYIILIGLLVAGAIAVISAIIASIVGSSDTDNGSGVGGIGGVGSVICTGGEINEEKVELNFQSAGVFTGMKKYFLDSAKKYGIDPVLLIAVAMHETGYGTSPAVVNKNNPGGLYDSSAGRLYSFDTLGEGIDAMASNLNRLYISQGLVTIPQIGNKYAPIGVANDPTNLNAYWIPTVTKMANQLGGLTANCTAMSTGTGEFAQPVGGEMYVTSPYGTRTHPVTGEVESFHEGVDLRCSVGDPIYAADSGTIVVAVKAGEGGGYGHHIIIDHGGLFTTYGHMTDVDVDLNTTVERGSQIGTCGSTGRSTGPHLHFEVDTDGIYGTPTDPMPYLKGSGEKEETEDDEKESE